MLDSVIGLLANVFQVATGLAAFYVFVLAKGWSKDRRRAQYERIVHVSDFCTSNIWIYWLRKAARRTSVLLRKLYGARNAADKSFSRGYLNENAFVVSAQLATIYLTLGVLAIAGGFLLLSSAESTGAKHRVMGAALFAASSVAILFAWKRRARPKNQSTDRFGALLAAALSCIAVPVAMQIFQPDPFILDSSSGKLSSAAGPSVVWVAPFVFVIAVAIHRGISRLHSSFGYLVPFALVAFLAISVPVWMLANTLQQTRETAMNIKFYGGARYDWPALIALIVLMVRAYLYGRIQHPKLRFGIRYLAILSLTLPAMKIFLGALWIGVAATIEVWTQPTSGGMPVYAYNLIPGVAIAILASLTYANALCDWISVAVTRRLLVSLADSRTLVVFVSYFLLDTLVAVILVALAYALFSALTHAFLLITPLPVDTFLAGLRSTATLALTLDSQPPISADGMYEFGSWLGQFVGVFALTAILPTVAHLFLLLSLIFGRIFFFIASFPARAILHESKSVKKEDDGTVPEGTIERVQMIGAIAVLLIAYLLLKALL